MNLSRILRVVAPCALLCLAAAGFSQGEKKTPVTDEQTQALVLLRGLPTLGTNHSVAIVELNPEAMNFGEILQEVEMPDLEIPLHHLYYSPNGRLYSTGLDPKLSLA